MKGIHSFEVYNDSIIQGGFGVCFLLVPIIELYSDVNRWHADIKLDNVLEIRGKFRLVDPGFAKFMERPERKTDTYPMADLSGGTNTLW